MMPQQKQIQQPRQAVKGKVPVKPAVPGKQQTTAKSSGSKAIIFDTGTLISFSMAGLLQELQGLRQIFKGKFLITEGVKKELIDKPLTIKKFELEALRLKQFLDDKVLELPDSYGITHDEIHKSADEILNVANRTFQGRGKDLHVIDFGEASALALSRILTNKGIDNAIAVDERTTRVLVERPENLKKILGNKLHTQVTSRQENYKFFQGFKIIRSSELAYVAWKKGIVKLKGDMVLDALLYAVKFKGAAISGDEIKEIKRLG